MLSDEGLFPMWEKMVTEMTEISMGKEYARAGVAFVEQKKAALDGYDGFRKYLDGIGFDLENQAHLVQVLRA